MINRYKFIFIIINLLLKISQIKKITISVSLKSFFCYTIFTLSFVNSLFSEKVNN